MIWLFLTLMWTGSLAVALAVGMLLRRPFIELEPDDAGAVRQALGELEAGRRSGLVR